MEKIDIRIKGVQKISLIDYPGIISCVVFLDKCNMRCPYCHNPELIFNSEEFQDITIDEFLEFLKKKKKWIEGVVITGGEPTLHPGLIDFMRKIKEIGLLIKLDTNGTNPDIIEQAINNKLVDFIAMDIKNNIDKYDETVRTKVDKNKIIQSIKTIIQEGNKNNIDYEFRTTILPKHINEEDIVKISELLAGSKKYVIQQFHKQDALLDDSYKNERTYTLDELNNFKKFLEKNISKVEIRE